MAGVIVVDRSQVEKVCNRYFHFLQTFSTFFASHEGLVTTILWVKLVYWLICCFSLGSRPYPLMATPYTNTQKVVPVSTPLSVAVTQSPLHAQAPSQRKSPHYTAVSPQTRTRQSPGVTEREIHASKQMEKEAVKRKHEENVRTTIAKKYKTQQTTEKTDGPKEMLQKLEEARLKDKTELPCEWPRVADGEFILENGEPKIWHCGQCDKSFAQRSLLQMHSCSRNTNRPYQCGHCAQEFAHPNELRTHAVIHSGKKPFKCGFCSRTFAGATTLNNHVRTHTGERPFSCNKCYKTFSQASQLSKHKRSLYDCYAWELNAHVAALILSWQKQCLLLRMRVLCTYIYIR